MTERPPMEALRSALRFAASRSCITSAEELAIMDAWNTRPQPAEAPASEWAMGVSLAVKAASDSLAAASIIQQYGDQRDAAGFRRGVEAAAKICSDASEDWDGWDAAGEASIESARRLTQAILALIETQEKGKARHD